MKWIDYERPHSVLQAVEVLSECGDRARCLAGGTDILVQLRAGRRQPDVLVDVKEIPELNQVIYDPIDGLTLGAAVPCYKIYDNPAVKDWYPAIVDSTRIIGGIPIQGRASLGGNLCNAAPSADSIPTLIVLGATVNVANSNGGRQVPVAEFCTGPGQTVLQPGELVVSIHFPPPAANSGAHYLRFTPRNEMDIAVAGAGAWVQLDPDGETIQDARVALAAVAPVPLPVEGVGEALKGKPATDDTIQIAAEMAREAARPITDMRGTAEFRRHLCEVLTRRALRRAIERAKEAK